MFGTIYEDSRVLYLLKSLDSDPMFIFRKDKNSFDTFLLLMKLAYQMAQDSMNDLVRELESALVEVKITNISLVDNKKYIYSGYNIATNNTFTLERIIDPTPIVNQIISQDEYSSTVIQNAYVVLGRASDYNVRLFYLLSSKIKKTFVLDDVTYDLTVDFIDSKELYPFKAIMRLSIRNGNKLDFYYVDLDTLDFYIDVDNKKKLLNQKFKEKILSALPSIGYDDLPSNLSKLCDAVIERVLIKKKPGKKGNMYELDTEYPLFYKHRFEECTGAYLFPVPKKIEPKKDVEGISFSAALNGNGYVEEVGTNSESIKVSIKSLLMKLKDQEFDRKTFSRIRISDSLFYSEITSEKKIIDPFFSDPKIMELVDLSEIDFTDADIEGFTLSGTGAKIVLDKLYNKSIKNAGLRNIKLYGQDLDGILADGADLRDTGVFVTLDKASIVGTLFSSSTTFALNGQIISDNAVKKMGISIEEDSNEINLTTGVMSL